MSGKKDFPGNLRAALRPLLELEKKIPGIEDPRKHPNAPMVMTLVRFTKGKINPVLKILETAQGAFPDITMVGWGDPSQDSTDNRVQGRVSVYVHPSLYRAIKLTWPLEVGGIVKGNRLTRELSHGSLGQAVGSLTAADFRPVLVE